MSRTYACDISDKERDILRKNPHCISFFCDPSRIRLAHMKPRNFMRFVYSRTFNKKKDWVTTSNIPPRSLHHMFCQSHTYKTVQQLKDTLKRDAVLPARCKARLFSDNTIPAYMPRGQRPSTQLHLGQLKLFLSTLQFLMLYAPKHVGRVQVVYPGSAPGTNIQFLSELFPHCDWYLVDPRPFYPALHTNKKMNIWNDYLTSDILEEIKRRTRGTYTLLISDIRVVPRDKEIERDNRLQESWVRSLKPSYAQLKFRIPRLTPTYTYLTGDAYFQMFAAPASTELRLVVDGTNLTSKTYDVAEYEALCYYFNRVLRVSYYKSRIQHECLDHCHDCVLMKQYMQEFKRDNPSHVFCKQSVSNMIDGVFTRIRNVRHRFCTQVKQLKQQLRTPPVRQRGATSRKRGILKKKKK